jgi:hypothetical protein
MLRGFRAAVMMACLVVLVGAGSGAAVPPPGQSVPLPVLDAPLAPGPAPDLDLVFTAQVAGWIEPCG